MENAARIAAIILAAGASKRLGSPKQLQKLGDETLLEHAVRVAREAGCSPIIVVLGAEYEQVLKHSALGDVVPVINHEWAEGMGSSIRLGVRTCGLVAKETRGLIVMTCDQPAVTSAHLGLLMQGQREKASRYAGRNGAPAFFPERHFGKLMILSGDVGARELLASAEAVELEHGDLDVDTVEDLECARNLFG